MPRVDGESAGRFSKSIVTHLGCLKGQSPRKTQKPSIFGGLPSCGNEKQPGRVIPSKATHPGEKTKRESKKEKGNLKGSC